MSKKKDSKRNVIINLIGLGVGGNEFGRSRSVSSAIGIILIILGLGFLVLAIISKSHFFNSIFSFALIGIGVYRMRRKKVINE